MNYKEARTMHIEDYIQFECVIFSINKLIQSSPLRQSLHQTLKLWFENNNLPFNLSLLNLLAKEGIKFNTLRFHKNIRNSLVHSHKSKKVNGKIIQGMKTIKNLNKKLAIIEKSFKDL